MPALSLSGANPDSLYCHVYNRGIENKVIFNDEEDYKIFLSYLKEYLSAPADTESSKKVFSIRGRAFRGTPHQPKNYLNQVELVAYSLMPNHFHLLVNLKSKDSLQSFIRSLCTRYSMYFNKKHHRTGSLFQGPYKSILIRDESCVLHLTRHLHRHGYSSYPEYVGTRVSSWVKSNAVLSYFEKAKINSFKEAKDYKYFVEEYKPNQTETELLKKISLEDMAQNFEDEAPQPNGRGIFSQAYVARAHSLRSETSSLTHGLTPGVFAKGDKDVVRKEVARKIEDPPIGPSLKPKPRIPEFIVLNTLFFFLLTLGISNITASPDIQFNPFSIPTTVNFVAKNIPPSTMPQVLSLETEPSPSPTTSEDLVTVTEDIKPKEYISITIDDGSASVNIRKEPMIDSEKIGDAKNGEIFEMVSKDMGWYEIKLADGSTGFISAKYIKKEEGSN